MIRSECGFDEETLSKVYYALESVGLSYQLSVDAVNAMQDQGVLFRERINK
jgi:hypothetical protein